jgi:hypothetical protein
MSSMRSVAIYVYAHLQPTNRSDLPPTHQRGKFVDGELWNVQFLSELRYPFALEMTLLKNSMDDSR